jgi:hypothetical protein
MNQLSLFDAISTKRSTATDVGTAELRAAPEQATAVDQSATAHTPIVTMLDMSLDRAIRASDIDNRRLEGLLDQIENPLPIMAENDLRDARDKVNATGLSLREWLDAAAVTDILRNRAMWACDYDPFEIRHINAGEYPPGYTIAEPEPRYVYSPPYPPNTIGAILRPADKSIDPSWKTELARHKSRGGRVKYDSGNLSTSEATSLPALPAKSMLKQATKAGNALPAETPAAMRRLTVREQQLLTCMIIENGRAVFGPDQRIPDWNSLKEVMETLGARYATGGKGRGGTRRKGAFTFPDGVDAEETLWLARERGEILDPTLVGAFFSPEVVADRVAGKLQFEPAMRIIEPSAGTGSIVKAIRRVSLTAIIECVELLDVHRAELRAMGLSIIGADFLATQPEDHEPFDAAAMNPPFNGGAECHHVLHAARFVRPGGQLVSVVSRGVIFRKDAPYSDLAAWLKTHGQIEELPDGSFADSGTWIRTSLLWGRTCHGCRSGECWRGK